MPQFPGFCGPSNTQRAFTVDAERTINYYPTKPDAGAPKADASLQPTPGLKAFSYLGSGGVRALFGEDGRAFGVGGSVFYELLPSGNILYRGTVQTNGLPATISSNGAQGHQLFITSGGKGYIFDLISSVFTLIVDADFPSNALQGVFFDSSFIVLDGTTGAFQVSALYDGLDWNGLDIGIESQFADRVIAMTHTHDNLWLFGTRNTGPWANSGIGGAAGFVPIPGALIEHGTAAAFACVELDNAPIWLGQDAQGGGMVWRANGYTPVRISTEALELQLLPRPGYAPNLSAAQAYGYQEQGHTFYVLYVPGVQTTWCYDIATSQWHERSTWDPKYGRDFPHVGINHCYIWGKHLIGDRQSGAVYEQSLAFPDELLIVGAA